jgi:protein arginine kinase activator
MQCDVCGKKEATVHLTEIINEQMTKLHLCEECAKEKGAEMEEHFGLSDLLAGLAGLGASIEPKVAETIKCANCGFTYQDFTKIGRFGCSECYDSFKKHLAPLLKRIHGADRHVGKVPLMAGKTARDARNLQDLRMKLEKAIQSEEFEEAARLRDKIKEVETRLDNQKSDK